MTDVHDTTVCHTKACTVDGCENPATRKGMCNSHYHRLRWYGDPLGYGEGNTNWRKVENPLSDKLRQLSIETGLTLDDLTVLAPTRDPYRLDTPANRRDGAWFKERLDACGIDRLHNRGIHYAIFSKGSTRPDGRPYLNDDDSWIWLEERASKASRWLGYTPFDAVVDARNSEPIVRLQETYVASTPHIGISGGLEMDSLDGVRGLDFSPLCSLTSERRGNPTGL